MNDREQQYQAVTTALQGIYTQKNTDYGDSFVKSLDEFGTIAFVVRASDKMERMKQLVRNKALVVGESLDDTVSDMANYCIMYLMHRRTQDESMQTAHVKRERAYRCANGITGGTPTRSELRELPDMDGGEMPEGK